MRIETRNAGNDLEVSLNGGEWFPLLTPALSLSNEDGAFLCAWVASQWECMPGGSASTVQLPRIFSQPQTDSLTFYAGSFNPWHEGHSACLNLTPQKCIVVVPDANPWKDSNHRQSLNPWHEILKLQKLIGEKYSIYPGFWSDSKSNPTVDWLPHTLLKWRGFIVGADSLINIPKWKEASILLAAINTLYVAPRDVDPASFKKAWASILEMAPSLELVMLAHHPYEHLSSSELRK